MRKMTDGKQTITVFEWIMIGEVMWEYYVTENWNEDNEAYCLVDGEFQEIGLVSLDEIKPYIVARTSNLHEFRPAVGWEWVK